MTLTAREVAAAGLAVLILVVAGYAVGRAQAPTKVETKIEYQDKIVDRVVTRDVVHEVAGPVRVVTTTRMVPGACGAPPTPETVVVEERGPVVIDTTAATVQDHTEERSGATTTVVEREAPRWSVGASYGLRPGEAASWGADARLRVAGAFWVGLQATTARDVRASLAVTF
jgi:hypothetical protein